MCVYHSTTLGWIAIKILVHNNAIIMSLSGYIEITLMIVMKMKRTDHQ